MKKLIVSFAFALLNVNLGGAAITCLGGQPGSAGIRDSVCNFALQGTSFGAFTSSVGFSFNDSLKKDTANAPQYDLVSSAGGRLASIDTVGLSALPLIHLNVDPGSDTLGKAGTRVFSTVSILRQQGWPLSGLQLFMLPDTVGGLPTFVSSWNMVGPDSIVIRLDRKGPLDLVFGVLSGASAQVSVKASPDTFDFSNPIHRTLSLTGSGFKTLNPLILITPVRAGGTASSSVISSSYPIKSVVVGAGIHSLGSNLEAARFFAYYQRVFSADSNPNVPSGFPSTENKPFSLNSVSDSATFMSAVNVAALDDSANASGVVSVPILPDSISVSGWKNLAQPFQATRGLELVVTVFDGGNLSRSKVLIPATFHEGDLVPGDQQVDFAGGRWNLYSYPWDEAAGGPIGRVVGDTSTTVTPDFRVLRYTGTGPDQGYVDLTPADFSDSIDLGRGFWSGRIVAGSVQPITAGGVSQDYRTFSFPLTVGIWNDFGTPFNFPIRLRDVLDSSGGINGIDTSFHIWPFNPGVGSSVSGSWGKNSKPLNWGVDTLFPWMGYSVYAKKAGTLKFPVRDVSRSNTFTDSALAKSAASAVWEASVQVLDKTATAGLTVGKGQSGYAVEEGPSAPGQDFQAVLLSGGARWSAIQENAAQGLEGQWSLDVTPEPGFSGVDLRIAERKGVSEPLTLVETVSGTSASLSGDSSVHLTAQALAKGDYHIVAGSSEYAQSFLQGVTAANQLKLLSSPNPFSAAGTSIQFSLPTTFTQVTYQVRIFNFQGRTVWEKTFNGGSELNTFWNGRDRGGQLVPAGQYRLLIVAQAPGKTAFRAQSTLIKVQ